VAFATGSGVHVGKNFCLLFVFVFIFIHQLHNRFIFKTIKFIYCIKTLLNKKDLSSFLKVGKFSIFLILLGNLLNNSISLFITLT
jgi:hypothetical protein